MAWIPFSCSECIIRWMISWKWCQNCELALDDDLQFVFPGWNLQIVNIFCAIFEVTHTSLPQTPDCPRGVKSSFIFPNTAGCRSQSGLFEEYVIPQRQKQKLNSASQMYHPRTSICWFLFSFIPKHLFSRDLWSESLRSITLDSVCTHESLSYAHMLCSFHLLLFSFIPKHLCAGGLLARKRKKCRLDAAWRVVWAARPAWVTCPHLSSPSLTSQGCCLTCRQKKI